MKRGEIAELTCSLAGALSEVGDPWSLLIVKELMLRNRRFDGIAAQTGISESSLAVRLKRLEKFGIIERRAYQDRPPRYEYRLSSKGADLWPALVTLTRWGDRWRGRTTPPLTFCCEACGSDARPRLTCESCSEVLDGRAVRAMQSREMQADRADRASSGGTTAPI
jgi:DNA-binding HxlR family transcriptional regulator